MIVRRSRIGQHIVDRTDKLLFVLFGPQRLQVGRPKAYKRTQQNTNNNNHYHSLC